MTYSGLARSINVCSNIFVLRIWIEDNSGSMQNYDTEKSVGSIDYVDMVRCTRWEELRECIIYHTHVAGLLEAPSRFRLLNPLSGCACTTQFGIGEMSAYSIQNDIENAKTIMDSVQPGGFTPLTEHITDIHRNINPVLTLLERKGKKVTIVITTDGLPTDENGNDDNSARENFLVALRSFENFPVSLVIRLCTNESKIVNFYNALDRQIELSVTVLFDWRCEARRVYEHNCWLNYGIPLHRYREMGCSGILFNKLISQSLSLLEIKEFCSHLFGYEHFDESNPSINFHGFMKSIRRALESEKKQLHPLKKKMKPWISLKKLRELFDNEETGCCSM